MTDTDAEPTAAEPPPRSNLRQVLRNPGYGPFLAAKFLATFAAEVLVVAVSWQIYDLTGDPLHLGLVGLVQFLPALLLVTMTGQAADRFRRRSIMQLCLLGEALATAALLTFTLLDLQLLWPIYAALVGLAVARAFFAPAQQSLAPNLVPLADLSTAVACNSAAWQLAMITGPMAGGLLYGLSATTAQGTALVLSLAAFALVWLIPKAPRRAVMPRATWSDLLAGFRYIWQAKVVLGAISLDLFAVLLGGATALLPVYARDILEVGPLGLGLLRSGAGVGALVTALWLARRPLTDQVGPIMFGCVVAFGLATVVFGFSTSAWLSIAALVVMGATDMISVYVRGTLIQLWTPDALRGRVNAVNMVFIGASNELGAFRAGTLAAGIGAVASVVAGGVGTLLVALLWMQWFPALRRIRTFAAPAQAEASGA